MLLLCHLHPIFPVERYRVKAKITFDLEFTDDLTKQYTAEYKQMIYNIQEAVSTCRFRGQLNPPWASC